MLASVRSRLASVLEEGRARELPGAGALVRATARAWAPLATRGLTRPLVAPDGVALITVGGATLGGSGRTRLALAVAAELATRGVEVALVGHAYRARPGCARVVTPADELASVGDEALACARALAGAVDVVVAPTRDAAVALAAERGARVVVVDGPLRTRPSRPQLALLAVDAAAPWGAGQVPPAGDLRAPIDALVAAADLVVEVDAPPTHARLDGDALPLEEVASRARAAGSVRRLPGALGLFTAVARPARLGRALARAGIPVAATVSAPDHGPLDAALLHRLRRAEVEHNIAIWLASPKCAEHLGGGGGPAQPVATLVDRFTLPPAVAGALARVVG